MDGTLLWQINLGKNIREGAHYTQFMVYDLDGDGIAEFACKTADGTIDGKGNVIGDPTKDWRNLNRDSGPFYGKILDGPEYFTIFSGKTGEALATTNYIPNRYPLNGWNGHGGNGGSDSTGNRVDRFLACVTYLDGVHPSVVMCRGYYGRSVLAAWDWREEVIFRTSDNQNLRIYTTTIPTNHRIYTLMHDPQYRLAVATENVAYNQPPHTGFFLGTDMKKAPKPCIVLVK